MRSKLIGPVILALATTSFVGCTTAPTTQTNYDQTTKKVYTKAELDKRGRQTPAEALAAQDEQITIMQGRGR